MLNETEGRQREERSSVLLYYAVRYSVSPNYAFKRDLGSQQQNKTKDAV